MNRNNFSVEAISFVPSINTNLATPILLNTCKIQEQFFHKILDLFNNCLAVDLTGQLMLTEREADKNIKNGNVLEITNTVKHSKMHHLMVLR